MTDSERIEKAIKGLTAKEIFCLLTLLEPVICGLPPSPQALQEPPLP